MCIPTLIYYDSEYRGRQFSCIVACGSHSKAVRVCVGSGVQVRGDDACFEYVHPSNRPSCEFIFFHAKLNMSMKVTRIFVYD